ncbi:MAG: hypothetical protein SCALA702_32660 [Melioribacteraceae bacterium]|nr:MAG: hypothetical protein SCALA702_32660 [Melioribacteraceae bacterium]
MNRILLIYNSGDNIQDLNILLTNSGFNTYLADDVYNGIEIARIYIPDLILCDVINNGVSGEQVVRELSENERTRVIPLVFLSSEPDLQNMRKIMNAGADDYISYPFENDDLISAIRTRLKKYSAIKEKYDQLRTETIETSGDHPVNEDHVLVKIGTNLRIIKFTEIVCVSAAKEYTNITTKDNRKLIIRKSLKRWLEILPEQSFVQIHRSTLINLDYVEGMKKLSDQSYEIKMKNHKAPFQVSVRNAKKIKKWFHN